MAPRERDHSMDVDWLSVILSDYNPHIIDPFDDLDDISVIIDTDDEAFREEFIYDIENMSDSETNDYQLPEVTSTSTQCPSPLGITGYHDGHSYNEEDEYESGSLTGELVESLIYDLDWTDTDFDHSQLPMVQQCWSISDRRSTVSTGIGLNELPETSLSESSRSSFVNVPPIHDYINLTDTNFEESVLPTVEQSWSTKKRPNTESDDEEHPHKRYKRHNSSDENSESETEDESSRRVGNHNQ